MHIQLKFIKLIGRGTYGYIELYKFKNKDIVVKTFHNDKVNIKMALLREYKIGIRLKHKFIRETFDCDLLKNILYLEYCNGEDMFDYLQHTILDISDKLYYFNQITQGIQYMHKNNIAHMDLKLENIMIDTINKNIKIIDLGNGINFNTNTLHGLQGTMNYCAPEEFVNINYNPEKIDIWALGIILYELIFDLSNPWKYAHTKDVNYKEFYEYYVKYNKLLPSLFDFTNTYKLNFTYVELKFILLHSLHIDSNMRCNINYIKTHLDMII